MTDAVWHICETAFFKTTLSLTCIYILSRQIYFLELIIYYDTAEPVHTN
jgi:hypothetical protein